MLNKQVVFIMGTGHCGSTLLDLILSSHPHAFGLGELSTLYSIFQEDEPACGICLDECEYWDRRASSRVLNRYFSTNQTGRVNRVLRRLGTYHRSIYSYMFDWFDADVLIDSSKSERWIKKQLKHRHQWKSMSPVLLYVVRDGRAVVNSYLRKYPERGIRAITLDWMDRTERMMSYFQSFEGVKHQVQYEELAEHPERVITEVCKTLQIKYEPSMLEYWKHDHHIIDGNAGTRSMIHKHRGSSKLKAGEWNEGYYDKMAPSIQLDLRWRRELSDEQVLIFEEMAGHLNEDLAYAGKPNASGA